VPPPKTPKEVAERERGRRHDLFASGAYPYGEKQLNPKRKETAYEYTQWAATQKSHSIQEGSYRDMLESEERRIGQTSYPPGHPRREAAVTGREPLPPGSRSPEAPERPPEGFGSSEGTVPAAVRTPGLQAAVRPNRFKASCANCGETVLPGEGRMERQPEGWVAVHNPKCP
jgi:hypothetical protein